MTFRLARLATAALSLSSLAYAQTLEVDNTTIPADTNTVAPAKEDVPVTSSDATAALFSSETAQLTDSVIANLTSLNLTAIDLFSFDGGNATVTKRASSSCKVFPGDLLYPPKLIWTVFDLLTGGAIEETVPLAAPCYNGPQRDAAKCSYITANFQNNSFMHAEDRTSVMWPLYQGRTCMPTLDPTQSCTLGAFPSYSIAVTNVFQIQLAVNFARNANLRLVVKNTGHDFNGKSAGAGALSIWTHKLKSLQFYQTYTQGSYNGPAFKLGSGVQAIELYEAANKYGVTAIGGEGRSVGVTGGYLAGGGHSPLSSIYGMAADHVLSLEVVTPDGRFVTASETSNSDLYWALRGGGGSTFGVVTSVVVKAYPKIKVATATWSFTTSATVSADTFWAGVKAYFAEFINYTDAGNYEYFQLIPIGPGAFLFGMAPFFAPGKSAAELQTLIAPLLAKWSALGINVTPVYKEYDNFYDAWFNSFPLEAVGSTTIKTASRLFPKANFQDQTKFNATVQAVRDVIEAGAVMLAFNIAAAPKGGFPDNAVNPAWRNTVLHAIAGVTWNENDSVDVIAAASKKLTFEWMQKWRDVSPGAGAYMSEADILEPNFQQAFYGTNYARLYALKQKLDPTGLFYAPTGVGSEDWYITGQVDGLPTQNGKLCRA